MVETSVPASRGTHAQECTHPGRALKGRVQQVEEMNKDLRAPLRVHCLGFPIYKTMALDRRVSELPPTPVLQTAWGGYSRVALAKGLQQGHHPAVDKPLSLSGSKENDMSTLGACKSGRRIQGHGNFRSEVTRH